MINKLCIMRDISIQRKDRLFTLDNINALESQRWNHLLPFEASNPTLSSFISECYITPAAISLIFATNDPDEKKGPGSGAQTKLTKTIALRHCAASAPRMSTFTRLDFHEARRTPKILIEWYQFFIFRFFVCRLLLSLGKVFI